MNILDDDELVFIDGPRDVASAGDVCDACDHRRDHHDDYGCEECACKGFNEPRPKKKTRSR